ncbi:MAG: hypothetical protein KC443_26235 [Anaerolineales bacterium]|nr:hypothetical protein [Anaerolineales bacterium]
MKAEIPGLVVLLGSGETLPSSGKIHEYVARQLPQKPHIVILETPAGFEPNSDRVAGKIKEFLERRLQNYKPDISVLPARKRGTPFSPDNADIVSPILTADEILLGPGSPTYGSRQLRGSLALRMIAARHRLGATLFLSSSATLSFGALTMPVYEIYKVGEDLHWQRGLDFLAAYGLSVTVIPHWNNSDGGTELDTSHCYVGEARFTKLQTLLPAGQCVLGIDEHTAVIINFADGCCQVMGSGTATVLRDGTAHVYEKDSRFSLDVLGEWYLPLDGDGIPTDLWQAALAAAEEREREAAATAVPSAQVYALVAARDTARAAKDWQTADSLRDEILNLGWQVLDTPDGSELLPLDG